MFKETKGKKYGIYKKDNYNWCIFCTYKNKKKKKVKKDLKFYPTLEKAATAFLDFKVGKALIDKKLNEKKILKAIKKAKEVILMELKNVKSI